MNRAAIDTPLLITCLVLILIGIVMVYSASAFLADAQFQDSNLYLKKQIVRVFLGLSIIVVVLRIDYRWYRNIVKYALLIGFCLLVYVILASNVGDKQSLRWIRFAGLGLQPSEVMKYILIFYMADTLSRKKELLTNFVDGFIPLFIILSLSCLLILKEPDLSTAVVVFLILFAMFFMAKVRLRYLVVSMGVFGLMSTTMILYKPYMRERVMLFLNPESDILGKGYQVQQSLIGLGSGGIFGQGLAAGKQKLLYLPEPYTDFIYAIIGEEMGFLGTVTVLGLFCYILYRGIKIAETVQDDYGFLLTGGLTLSLVIPAFINMAVACGICPTTGLPMPFVSYGGTSLLFCSLAVGVLLNISSHGEKSLKDQNFNVPAENKPGAKRKITIRTAKKKTQRVSR